MRLSRSQSGRSTLSDVRRNPPHACRHDQRSRRLADKIVGGRVAFSLSPPLLVSVSCATTVVRFSSITLHGNDPPSAHPPPRRVYRHPAVPGVPAAGGPPA